MATLRVLNASTRKQEPLAPRRPHGGTGGGVMAPVEPVACPACREPFTRATLGRHLVEAPGLRWEDGQFVARNLAAE
jgi:hypothetical protein